MITRNRGERLLAAIQSVLDQSLPPDEYEAVVVDDGSTDGTRERVQELAARLLFMDDDDLLPEALERTPAARAPGRSLVRRLPPELVEGMALDALDVALLRRLARRVPRTVRRR